MSLALALLLTSFPAHAIWEAAEGEVFLSLEAAVSADSNIASNALELSDTTYSLTPGVSWERERGLTTISLSGECEIERADEYDAYDSENYSAAFSLDLAASQSRRLRGAINASYFDGSRVDSYQNTRISESSYRLGMNGSYQVTAKINGRAGASYANTDPEDLAQYEDTALNLGVGYNFRPDVSAYLDFRFTDSSSDFSEFTASSTDTSGNAVIVGLDGQITAKLTGHIGVGYDWSETTSRTASGSFTNEYTGPTYDIALTWAPRERTTVALTAANGIQSTSTGGTDYVSIALTLAQEIGLNVTANAGLTFRSSDFASEERGSDDVMEATAGARYAVTRNISFGLSYTYTDSDSTNELITYTRSVWRLFGSARF